MSWIEELSSAMARTVIELATEYENAPLSVIQDAVETALDNLKTAELTTNYFGDPSSVAPKEAAFLRSAKRNLIMEAAANLLLYWVALGRKEQMEDAQDGTGIRSGVRGST